MKALIQKDLMAVWKYCRIYVLMCAVFLFGSVFTDEYGFLRLYPLLFMGMLTNTLIAYDERDKWEKLAITMPLTRRQIVSGKYLVGLILQAAVLVLTVLVQWLKLHLRGTFAWESFAMDMALLLAMTVAAPSLMLPAVFKNGSEKGRLSYLITMGVSFGLGVSGSMILEELDLLCVQVEVPLMGLAAAVVLLLYPASWCLSVHWYEKREF